MVIQKIHFNLSTDPGFLDKSIVLSNATLRMATDLGELQLAGSLLQGKPGEAGEDVYPHESIYRDIWLKINTVFSNSGEKRVFIFDILPCYLEEDVVVTIRDYLKKVILTSHSDMVIFPVPVLGAKDSLEKTAQSLKHAGFYEVAHINESQVVLYSNTKS